MIQAGEFQDDPLDETTGRTVSKRRIRGQIKKQDQTCVDSDDDDFEFEDAKAEEQRDMQRYNASNFMIGQEAISQYIQDQTLKNQTLDEGMKTHIPNKILDSQFLRQSFVDE